MAKQKYKWRVYPEGWVEYNWVKPNGEAMQIAGPPPEDDDPYVAEMVKKMMEGKGYKLEGYTLILE